MPETPADAAAPLRVLVYSDDAEVRRSVVLALGPRPAKDLPLVEFVEIATEPVVQREVDAGGIDLAILDGEAWPAGGMGICRQIKAEHEAPPPILVLIARVADQWLATWSLADAVVPMPIDPAVLAEAAADLLRGPEATLPARIPAG